MTKKNKMTKNYKNNKMKKKNKKNKNMKIKYKSLEKIMSNIRITNEPNPQYWFDGHNHTKKINNIYNEFIRRNGL